MKFLKALSKLSIVIMIVAGALFLGLGYLLFRFPEKVIKCVIGIGSILLMIFGAVMLAYGIVTLIICLKNKVSKQ